MKKKRVFWPVLGKLILVFLIAFGIAFALSMVCMVLLALLNVIPLQELVNGDFQLQDPVSLSSMVLNAAQAAGFIGAAIIMYQFINKSKQQWSLGWRQQKASVYMTVGMITGIVLMTISFFVIWLCGGIEIDDHSIASASWGNILLYLLLFLIVAVNEELISRGYIQGLLSHHYGNWMGIIVSSVIFALLHSFNAAVWENWVPMFNLFLAGILFAICRVTSGGLWVPIGLHLTWNFFQGNVFGFPVSGTKAQDSIFHIHILGSNLLSGGDFGAEGSIVITVILAVSIVVASKRIPSKMARKNNSGKDPTIEIV